MAKRFTVVFCLIVLLIFVGVVFAADKNGVKSGKRPIERIHLRGDEPTAVYTPSNKYPSPSSVTPYLDCEDIWPEMQEYEGEYVLEHYQIGDTWIEYQKNNSMGRMMSVTDVGFRHFSWMDCSFYAMLDRYVKCNFRSLEGTYNGEQVVDGGVNEYAGFSNQDHLSNGISVVSFHRFRGTPIPYSMIAMEEAVGTSLFNRFWDMPDSIVSCTNVGMWPKLAIKYDPVDGRDYIHYTMTECVGGEFNLIGLAKQAYVRAYLQDANTMVIQIPRSGATALILNRTSNTIYSPNGAVYEFGVSCDISAIPIYSPVSRRVALTYMPPACGTDCQSLNDVAFLESMDNGDSWMTSTGYPGTPRNVTNYGCAYPSEQAVLDHAACYDYDDSLHFIWVTAGWSEPGYWEPENTKLWHWSKAANGGVPTIITSKITDETNPPSNNLNIAKMSISARDPIFSETEKSTASLYTIWTQFDEGDLSAGGFTNGELYGTTSGDGGLTWGNVYNLTQTRTPDCKWDCVGEHWSSLAANMYEGNLHIQYVCDFEAGAAILDGTQITQNPVFYYTLKSWAVGERCEGLYKKVDPGSFHKPEVKVPPGGARILTLKLTNVGNTEMPYTAVAVESFPGGCISGEYSGMLYILGEVSMIFTVNGAGECEGTFIRSSIELNMCDASYILPVHAISALDYYECPTDPETYNTVETSNMKVYVCANSLEWVEDKGLIDPDIRGIERVFSRGGPFVATTIEGYKVVGRFYGDNDFNAGVRDKLYTDLCDYDEFDCYLIYTKNIYIIPPPDLPIHCWWGWWEWSKVVKVCDLPGNKKIVIKYIRVQRYDPPSWWPVLDPPQVFTGYDDTYIGMMMDIDCPSDFDVIRTAENFADYDEVNQIAWQQGFFNLAVVDPHPEYAEYYAGMALADPAISSPVIPYAAHNIRNDVFLFPQYPWGWLDEQLYDLAATEGISIQDQGLALDRSWVMTAEHIPAGFDPNADHSFVVIEAMTPNGLTDLQALIAYGREIVVDEALNHGIPIICGDVNGNGAINLGDAVYLLSYLFKGGAAPLCPMNRADVNSNGAVNLGDAVYLLSYLFKGGAKPVCPGLF